MGFSPAGRAGRSPDCGPGQCSCAARNCRECCCRCACHHRRSSSPRRKCAGRGRPVSGSAGEVEVAKPHFTGLVGRAGHGGSAAGGKGARKGKCESEGPGHGSAPILWFGILWFGTRPGRGCLTASSQPSSQAGRRLAADARRVRDPRRPGTRRSDEQPTGPDERNSGLASAGRNARVGPPWR